MALSTWSCNQLGIDSTPVLAAMLHTHLTRSSGAPDKTASVYSPFLLSIICHHAEINATYIKHQKKWPNILNFPVLLQF